MNASQKLLAALLSIRGELFGPSRTVFLDGGLREKVKASSEYILLHLAIPIVINENDGP